MRTSPPSLTFRILPGISLLPKAKGAWWPAKQARSETQVSMAGRDIFYISVCVLFLFLHEKLGKEVFKVKLGTV